MPIKRNRQIWLLNTAIVAGLVLVSGCAPEESAPTSAPTSPLPNATPSRPSAPPVAPEKNPVEPGKTSKVEQDLKKDLGGPVIKPDTTNITPPAPVETKKP
jgi:hypothetical protein